MIPHKMLAKVSLNVMILYEMISDGKEKGVAISRNSLIFKALQDGLEPTTP